MGNRVFDNTKTDQSRKANERLEVVTLLARTMLIKLRSFVASLLDVRTRLNMLCSQDGQSMESHDPAVAFS